MQLKCLGNESASVSSWQTSRFAESVARFPVVRAEQDDPVLMLVPLDMAEVTVLDPLAWVKDANADVREAVTDPREERKVAEVPLVRLDDAEVRFERGVASACRRRFRGPGGMAIARTEAGVRASQHQWVVRGFMRTGHHQKQSWDVR